MPDPVHLSDLDATRTYDIGHGVTFKPHYGPYGSDKIVGAIITHPIAEVGGECSGVITWDTEGKTMKGRPVWKVEQEDPLTLSPSIDCTRHPEGHGYIRNGLWEST